VCGGVCCRAWTEAERTKQAVLLQGNRKASTKKQYEPYINGFKVTKTV
jgi:hypothetical protein